MSCNVHLHESVCMYVCKCVCLVTFCTVCAVRIVCTVCSGGRTGAFGEALAAPLFEERPLFSQINIHKIN